ncbi:MAG: redoxin domain-containing protein [Dehalococcoidia bacterium]
MISRSRPWMSGALLLVLAALSVAGAACTTDAGADSATPTEAPNASNTGGEIGDFAPELTGIASWINTPPLTMEELRGKVVLIDFWTYTCVNCIRTYPYLREWHDKYQDAGLVILGLHAPEFDFERVLENVERAAESFELTYPIAQDNDFSTWLSYENRFWPAKYLVDSGGVVRYRHFGEGAYVETEEHIRGLLTEAGYDIASIPIGTDDGPEADRRASLPQSQEDALTREIYGGYLRNNHFTGRYVADLDYYDGAERVLDYTAEDYFTNQFIYLQGPWFNGLEALTHARETDNYEDYIGLQFRASTVNVVVGYEGEPYEVRVELNDRPVMEEEAGPDIVIDEDSSYFLVDEARMYEVIDLGEYKGGVLRLSSNSDQFSMYAMTFGAYSSGP